MYQSKVQNATVHTDCFVRKTVQSPNIFIKYILEQGQIFQVA